MMRHPNEKKVLTSGRDFDDQGRVAHDRETGVEIETC